jgi:hypothetical protein
VNFTRAAVALGHFKAIVAGQFVLACHAKAPAKSYPGSFIAADMHSITCAMASVDGSQIIFGIHLLASGARSLSFELRRPGRG